MEALALEPTSKKPNWPVELGGVKVTWIVHDAPTAKVAGQLLVCAKGPDLIDTEEMESATLPVLV
jgi:hypothetical protein